ncbi:MAG: hypothetical protein RL141_947 [Candidatus Parcubacteria bacterium]|jgi:hypothetical protein
MSIRIPKRDFLFIDESGDPGLGPSSSLSFTIGCLHVTDIGLEQFHRHYCSLGYFHTKLRELKSSRLSRLRKDQISDILKWLADHHHAALSAVTVDKELYGGPYLKPNGDIPSQPLSFRNFLNQELLKRHFINHPPASQEIEIIFDRLVSETEEVNLKRSLRSDLVLPRLEAITQCDSRFVPALQFVDAMVHIIKETLFGDPESVDGRLLDCINLFDLTNPVRSK